MDRSSHSFAVRPVVYGQSGRMSRKTLPLQSITWRGKSRPFQIFVKPVHAQRYVSLLNRIHSGQKAGADIRQSAGPAFEFPEAMTQPADIVVVENEQLLHQNFRGWVAGEIATGRAPVMAVFKDEFPVSICFCARSSDIATEAGVETAEAFRGRGFAPRVTAAWALAIRASGRIPLYSTSWTNSASLAVARTLGLMVYASSSSLSD